MNTIERLQEQLKSEDNEVRKEAQQVLLLLGYIKKAKGDLHLDWTTVNFLIRAYDFDVRTSKRKYALTNIGEALLLGFERMEELKLNN